MNTAELGMLFKHVPAAFAAFVGGLFWTWLCGYTLSHANLPQPKPIWGCRIEDCSAWWLGPLILAYYLFPAVVFAVSGCLAAARMWPVRKTTVVFALLVAATVSFYVYSFIG
jgi:hypothetical protein